MSNVVKEKDSEIKGKEIKETSVGWEDLYYCKCEQGQSW